MVVGKAGIGKTRLLNNILAISGHFVERPGAVQCTTKQRTVGGTLTIPKELIYESIQNGGLSPVHENKTIKFSLTDTKGEIFSIDPCFTTLVTRHKSYKANIRGMRRALF